MARVKPQTSHVDISDFPSEEIFHDIYVLAVVIHHSLLSGSHADKILMSSQLRDSSHQHVVPYSKMRQLATASAVSTGLSICDHLELRALLQLLLGVDDSLGLLP